MSGVRLREEPPGGDAGRFLRSAFWSEVSRVAGLPADLPADEDGAPPGDLVDLVPPGGAFVVAVRDGEPLGCVGVRGLADGSVEVKRLYVAGRARGLGVGRRLLTWCEDWARARGAARIVLDTHGALAAAVGLYRSAGFTEVAPYNDNPHAQLWFAKALT
ncbi:GNAT family N-acetyltransferase [Kineococcus sp. SYSU DK001]|uniref:GNAT family N-acetyltransferase n=1 Tax=Kineococcus sp. SYSU DK001 TaxID=3383122 RepID=UPI003D7C5D8B